MQFKLNIQKREKGGHIYATIPKVREDIPVIILFRALGCESDKQIFNMILSDAADTNMSEALRPSLEQVLYEQYQTQEQCLDFIAQRSGKIASSTRDKKRLEDSIQYAKELLRDNLLPHVGVQDGDSFKKAFFVGYMTNRLIQAFLGRTVEDDRDYYGKKRLDMAGALLCNVFR